MAPVREQTPRSGAPFRITALYVAFGATWVLVGDVGLLRPGLLTQHSWFLNLAKGLFFVAASALFLFYLLRRETAAAQQAQQAQRRLQRMDAVSRLAGGIAHEFNNLMTTVLGNAALLTETLPDGDARRAHAEQVRAAAGRAASLTRQLLTFSGRDVVRPTEVDVGALVAELAPVVVRMAGSDVRTRVSAQPGRHVTEADYGQLKQLILSLVVNAVEAMPDGGELTLEVAAGSSPARETAAGRDSVVIRCSDTGRGMDDQTMELIFEPFFSTKPQGAGLGLSTVHGIVQHAGGGAGGQIVRVLPRPRLYAEFGAAAGVRDGHPVAAAGAHHGVPRRRGDVAADGCAVRRRAAALGDRQRAGREHAHGAGAGADRHRADGARRRAIAAELASMKVTEQIDALVAMGRDPVAFLVVPRVVAGLLVFPPLVILANAMGWRPATSSAAGGRRADVGRHHLRHALLFPAVGAVLLGAEGRGVRLAITFIACFVGLSGSGGAEGVGRTTTQAVVATTLAIMILDVLLVPVLKAF
jgi:signal transduction histidine kinase